MKQDTDYLFDPTSKSDESDKSDMRDAEVQALESVLRPLRYRERAFDAKVATEDVSRGKTGAATEVTTKSRASVDEAPRTEPSRVRRLPIRGLAALSLAAVALLSVAVWRAGGTQPIASPQPTTAPSAGAGAFQVSRESGRPTIAGHAFEGQGSLGAGAWLETDANSRANIQVASIGTVRVSPDSRVQLVHTGPNEHRLALTRGRIDAVVSAPPRLFVVETPSAAAVDLGCAYHLVVQGDGATLLHVDTGQVSLEGKGKRAWVPAGAECLTKNGLGPGTPGWTNSETTFRKALESYDWNHGALDVVLREADTPDTLSLWHILQRVPEGEREKVAARIEKLAPGVTVSELIKKSLDEAALMELRGELEGIW